MPDVVYDAQIGVDGSSNPIYLRQITQSDFDPHYNFIMGRESGSPYVALETISDVANAAQYISDAAPEGQLTTVDIETFLTLFTPTGARVADGSTLVIPYQKRASGGTFQSGAHHVVIRGTPAADNAGSIISPAQLIPQSVTAPRAGAVTASGAIHYLSGDGLVPPFEALVGQTLPAQAFTAMWGGGPVWINGTRIARQVGFSVNFGCQYSEKQHYDGCPYPSDIFLEEINPVIEIQVEDFDQIASLEGVAQITQFSAFLRRRVPGGTYIADATAAHLKFSFANGIIVPQALRASETKHGNAALRISGVSLAVTSAAAVAGP